MSVPVRDRLAELVDSVLLPGFDGTRAPDWLRRRVSGSLGGVCLFARNIGSPAQVRELTDTLRAERDDVVVSIDEEAGDVTRLDAATGALFPGNYALGRVDDVAATEAIGAQVGARLAAAGVTVNFAPCADVLTDPRNPVIGTRSFGSDPDLVTRHTVAFQRGQQSAGVAACVKHFPGHGNTTVDTHLGTAVLTGSWDELRATELPPFRAGLAAGAASVMVGHLVVPAVDNVPATISRRWITDILRGDMGFDGVVITDALEMAAIAATVGVAEGAVRAIEAGADLLCLGGEDSSEDIVNLAAAALIEAVRSGRISEETLAQAASRIQAIATLPATRPPVDAPVPAEPARSVAQRALAVAGPLPGLGAAPLVLRLQAATNNAVGVVPWGPAGPLGAREIVLVDGDPLPTNDISAATGVLLVTRDRQRLDFIRSYEDALRALRPDAVLVEMGVGDTATAPAVSTGGAALVSSEAVARLLAG